MIAWAIVPFIVAALVLLHLRRNRFRKPLTELAPAHLEGDHGAAINLLLDWLTTPEIRKALVTTRTATVESMDNIIDQVHGMDRAHVVATTAALLRDKRVRRVIADHVSKKFGDIAKRDVLKGLLEMHEGGKGL